MFGCKIVSRVIFYEIRTSESSNVESAYDEFFVCRQNQLLGSELEMKDSISVGCIIPAFQVAMCSRPSAPL